MRTLPRALSLAALFCTALALAAGPSASAQTQGAGKDLTGPQRRLLQPLQGPNEQYRLRPGDTVDITFRFTPEFNDEVTIGPDGRASLKSTGNILMAGYTVNEVQRTVANDSAGKLVNPEVTVSLKDFERPHVVVAGEVQNPGRVELRSPITALQAVLLAGGPKEGAAMGRVVVFRKLNADVAEVHIVKLSHFDTRTRSRNDLVLEPGDMVLVQRDNLEKFGRFIKATNIGFYLNPFGNNGLF